MGKYNKKYNDVRAKTNHYVTIDSKYFTEDEFQRREGVHVDGNFCADAYFSLYELFKKLKDICENGNKNAMDEWNEKTSWGEVIVHGEVIAYKLVD